ncbi:hypothetical protein SELMODRAFT_405484 [Selaginella moellendorffii]|uniref:Uncharacterized protein n=1 Tax=Selaginella moellendorffii TaxID=88036 RepID=D8QYQ7_SELML|nr:hypothetical protein SELMODRAFT_405484 [Selaginella moellendorffii]
MESFYLLAQTLARRPRPPSTRARQLGGFSVCAYGAVVEVIAKNDNRMVLLYKAMINNGINLTRARARKGLESFHLAGSHKSWPVGANRTRDRPPSDGGSSTGWFLHKNDGRMVLLYKAMINDGITTSLEKAMQKYITGRSSSRQSKL